MNITIMMLPDYNYDYCPWSSFSHCLFSLHIDTLICSLFALGLKHISHRMILVKQPDLAIYILIYILQCNIIFAVLIFKVFMLFRLAIFVRQ